MHRAAFSILGLAMGTALYAQAYTSWFTGNPVDYVAEPLGGACMMGGASEFDPAMQWFLDRANGGDVLVLRASGSDGYNNYMYSDLGGVNSVETIRFNSAAASTDPYVADRIQKAEAIWFAGGDQWNYVNYWRNTPVMTLINEAIDQRHIAIGGTSAGMAILGGCYFSAQNGSVTSAEALSNPFNTSMTVDCTSFLHVPYMAGTITDTHYDNPDRRGRHFAFLARMAQQGDSEVYGIACNEYVAVCIDPQGMARVFGEWPEYEEYAYFLRANCVSPMGPETCQAGSPLTWYRQGMAVKAYKVPGTPSGVNGFDLNDHLAGQGGAWENWSATSGVFSSVPGDAPPCGTTAVSDGARGGPTFQWNPETGRLEASGLVPASEVSLFTVDGRLLMRSVADGAGGLDFGVPGELAGSLILVRVGSPHGLHTWKLVR
ncbi:MAG TPA: cyanophycinase [Flavobacteriales bacterium]|nr:cyanophycinase [Flavobacteriales bacterium]